MKLSRSSVILCLCALCCMAQDDAAKNHSTEMNSGKYASSNENHGGVKVLFLGNSITLHGAAPGIGWHGNWGMAASAPEKDYVHIVTRGIEERTKRKTDVHVLNLANFERNFRTVDNAKDLAKEIAFRPDIVIIALGENAPSLNTAEDVRDYQAAFLKLLKLFADASPSPKMVVRGVFWRNEPKDKAMEAAAKSVGAVFVKTDFSDDGSMKALGLFKHSGVQNHPGDKGMAEIARRILNGLDSLNSKGR